MNSRGIQRFYIIIRNFLFSSANKEFLIFLFFLCISGGFWLLVTLNEGYDREIVVPVRITNVPKNVVITSDTESSVKISVRDKGYFILAYVYGNIIHTLDIDYSAFAKNADNVCMTSSELQKLIYPMLYNSTRITSVKPDKLEFSYTSGRSKVIPVVLDGKLVPEKNYYISNTSFSPEKIQVYASGNIIDTITMAMTEKLDITNLSDTVVRTVSLRKVRGVKYVPSTVKVTICPDVLTEESFELPITAVNMPDNLILRTFPSRVRVQFSVGASIFRSIRPDQFKIVVDYNDILARPSEKCSLRIRKVPSGVRNVRLEASQVDYLVEGR